MDLWSVWNGSTAVCIYSCKKSQFQLTKQHAKRLLSLYNTPMCLSGSNSVPWGLKTLSKNWSLMGSPDGITAYIYSLLHSVGLKEKFKIFRWITLFNSVQNLHKLFFKTHNYKSKHLGDCLLILLHLLISSSLAELYRIFQIVKSFLL